ncbi:transcriptional regulator, XRE family protein [Candidatus Vecturithrix granuli]|uniref:Transcriptional regulator, XRE family protein n=1 Tax=Vecturithrix granuli TaxID=1499967 RepID=A0A081C305_VECG1|nr:transcriptional regulator, XRE family protein [Candidatus Vecturithrix granuli]
MDTLVQIVAENLKNYRETRNLSLEKLSQATGVSKGMLSQIENGNTNPSISTLLKIANGLKMSFTALLKERKAPLLVVDNTHAEPILADDQKCRLYPLFPFESGKRFEIYYFEMEPGAHRVSERCLVDHVAEYVFVQQGLLKITVGEHDATVHADQSITFDASRQHEYTNVGNKVIKAIMMLYYPEVY